MLPGSIREAIVLRVPMRHPGDTAEIGKLFDKDVIDPRNVVAIFGKTEGNGCVNDFTRGYSVLAIEALFAERLGCSREEVGDNVAIVISGGTEGGLSPHFLVFAVKPSTAPVSGLKGLAVGVAFTRSLLPEEIGRTAQVEATAAAVTRAIERAGIDTMDDVHFVQMKCPLLTNIRVADAHARGRSTATRDTYSSMGLSRAASALGAALALGEVAREHITDDAIGTDLRLWSGRASASAGIELDRTEIIVLGNSSSWRGRHSICHGVMRDAIDFRALQTLLREAGLRSEGQLSAEEAARISAVLVKADPPRSGTIRGARHVMWDDSDIHATRHARALVGGVVAAAMGRTDLFVSGGAEHQGPDGGGPIAIIVERE